MPKLNSSAMIIRISVSSIIFYSIPCCAKCIGTCYSGRVYPESQDIVYDKYISGHSYKNFTTDDRAKCYSSCVQDCRCKACQMKDDSCELLDEHRFSKSLVAAQGYVYYDLRQTLYHGEPAASHMVQPGQCYNGCCKYQSCQNGGTCKEHCQDPKLKFSCECPVKSTWGTVCENKLTSCADVFKQKSVKNGNVPKDGVYDILISSGTVLPLYCAFNISHKRAWTLIESLSFANRQEFISLQFHSAASINHLSPPSWERYRLPKQAVQHIRSKSTLFRSTCNFDKRARTSLVPDFLLARISDADITSPEQSFGRCIKYMYINIRGNQCFECTAPTYGNANGEHIHIDLSWIKNCNLYKPNLHPNANYFGYYIDDNIDSLFQCSMDADSTTEWWLGAEV